MSGEVVDPEAGLASVKSSQSIVSVSDVVLSVSDDHFLVLSISSSIYNATV